MSDTEGTTIHSRVHLNNTESHFEISIKVSDLLNEMERQDASEALNTFNSIIDTILSGLSSHVQNSLVYPYTQLVIHELKDSNLVLFDSNFEGEMQIERINALRQNLGHFITEVLVFSNNLKNRRLNVSLFNQITSICSNREITLSHDFPEYGDVLLEGDAGSEVIFFVLYNLLTHRQLTKFTNGNLTSHLNFNLDVEVSDNFVRLMLYSENFIPTFGEDTITNNMPHWFNLALARAQIQTQVDMRGTIVLEIPIKETHVKTNFRPEP